MQTNYPTEEVQRPPDVWSFIQRLGFTGRKVREGVYDLRGRGAGVRVAYDHSFARCPEHGVIVTGEGPGFDAVDDAVDAALTARREYHFAVRNTSSA